MSTLITESPIRRTTGSGRTYLYIGIAVVVLLAAATGGYFVLRSSAASDLKAKLVAVAPPNYETIAREEALKWNATVYPIPTPVRSVTELMTQAQTDAKAQVDPRYTPEALTQQAAAALAKLKLAKRGDVISFTLTSGRTVTGTFDSVIKKKYDTDIILRNPNALYQGREIAESDRYLFGQDALIKKINAVRGEIIGNAPARQESELSNLKKKLTEELLRTHFYISDNGQWVPLRNKVEKNAKMVYDGQLKTYTDKLTELCDEAPFMGHVFTPEELGVALPASEPTAKQN